MTDRSRLAVIDMQVAFRESTSEWAIPGYDDISPVITHLSATYTGQVIYTRFVRDATELGSWRSYYDRWSTMRHSADSPAWDLTIAPAETDPVISLPTFSKWGPQMERLVGLDDSLIVCGVATDCCVLATVLAAVDAGRSVTVVSDACAGLTPRAHDQTLDILHLLKPMVSVRTSDQL